MDDQDDNGSSESQPVERRAGPRAPISGFEVVGREEGGPLAAKVLHVEEVGLETMFLGGPDAASCSVGEQYRLRLLFQGQSIECTAECVRLERAPRVGAVLRLLAEDREARRLLAAVLKPSRIPRRTD